MDNEVSYDQVVEDGYRLAVDHHNPADILLNLAATKALVCEMNSLPGQQRCICRMVSAGMAEYEWLLNSAYHTWHSMITNQNY